jgi:CRISPR-associated exonuclease Cas4
MTNFTFITASDIIEYLYCPRFIYFQNILDVAQHEHERYLVNKGRDIHELKMVRNKDYLRKSIGCIDKDIDVYLTSQKLGLVGRMDEILTLNDYSKAPLDYKFATYEEKLYKTLKTQQVAYSLLIEENYNCNVFKAFIVYVRSKNLVKEIEITQKEKDNSIKIINEIFDILNKCHFPKGTNNKLKCQDCTYKNLCFS